MSHDDPTAAYDVTPARRPAKVAHLVLGLVFLGIAGIWSLDAAGLAAWTASRYLGPAVLVGAGLVGLAAMLLSGRRDRTEPRR